MNGILTVLALLIIASEQHIIKCQLSPISNATKVNIDNPSLIITGNELGEIGICQNSGTNATTRIITYHNAPIIFIERYMNDITWQHYMEDSVMEYVIVDQSGTVSIWNSNFTQILATLNLNVTVIGAAIRQPTYQEREARLALNCQTFIIELSLIQRKELRRLDDNTTFLALVYSYNQLIASSKKDNVSKFIYYNESGLSKIKQFVLPEDVIFLAKRNDTIRSDQSAVAGISPNINRIYRIFQNDTIQISQPLNIPGRGRGYKPLQANYFEYCRSRIKGGRGSFRTFFNGLLAIVYNDTLVLKSLQEKVRYIIVAKKIVDISCIGQHIYVLTKEGELDLFEMWQLEPKSEIFMAGVGLSLIVLVFALVGYKLAKRWAKKKDVTQICVQTQQVGKDIQLREFLIQESH